MRSVISPLSCICVMAVLEAFSAASPWAAQQQTTSRQPGAPTTRAMKVDLDELETHPEKYVGKTVIVEGEVDRVLGPHLFTIDERNWVDPERELPVVVPDPFAAIVRSDTPVRVTGIVQKVPIAEIERSRGFLTDAKIKAEIETGPALVATEVTTVAPAAVSLRRSTGNRCSTRRCHPARCAPARSCCTGFRAWWSARIERFSATKRF